MAARSTWEISAAIPVLYTHQKAVKRPSFKEGILRLSAGRATLCDSSGKVLDAETVTSSLLAQLKNQEELDFPGHLLQPDPTLEISVPSLPTEPEPSPSRRRGQTCLGVKPFKRPRTQPRSLSSFSTASSAAHSLPRPGRDEQDLSGALSAPSTVKNLGDESKATPTPCRQRLDLQGAGTRFRPPRPAPKWRDESEFKPNGPGLPGQREAFAPDHQEAEALALALRRAEAAPEQAEAQVLELCRQEVHTFRRAHLELDQQEEEARVLERQQEEALALDQHREAEAEVLWQQRLCDVQQAHVLERQQEEALALDQRREAEAEVLWQQRLCDVQQAHVLERQQEEALALDRHREAEAEVLWQQRLCDVQQAHVLERQQEEALALDQHRQAEAEVLWQQRLCDVQQAHVLERQQEERQAEAEAHFLARQQEEALALDQQRQAEAEAHFLERQQEEALALDQHRQAEAEAHFLERQQEEAVALDQQWQAQALQQRRSYALQEEQALELRQQEAHDAACQAQQRQPEAPALEPALQRQNEAFVLNPQQAEELRQQQERAIEEALAWERQAQAKPHGEALDRREQEDEDESGPQEDMEDEPESEAALSPDEEDLPLMEVMAKQEEDLPLAGMVAAQAKAHAHRARPKPRLPWCP
ncbi:unnamed protein product [Effrenium voratum]|uniref:Uncharacterized protein n=1 Tax=Effrenium voratum TaxID=2562239 RepID=A0AA36I2N0_9DINO|nr:unnamed protein product [Effrenium voratum]